MKKIFLIFLLINICTAIHLNAQYVVRQYSLKQNKVEKAIFTSTKIYLESFINKGQKPSDIVEKTVQKHFKYNEKSDDTNMCWVQKSWLTPVAQKSEADIIISGEYELISTTTAENKSKATFTVIFTFNYTNGSPVKKDTIKINQSYTDQNLPLEKVEDNVSNRMKNRIAYYTRMVSSKKVNINFPKVKIKDKALKEEYATIKELMKKGEYVKVGKIVKKLYQTQKSPELALILGICYEILGNYPKADEYYKIKPDFHAKVRMKNNMKILTFAKSIGYEPEYIVL